MTWQDWVVLGLAVWLAPAVLVGIHILAITITERNDK